MRVCLIPAAGASSRMRGGDKLLEDVDGAPCLRVMVERAQASGAQVIVTLPALDHPRAQALHGTGAQLVAVPQAAAEGMSASLKAGVRAVPRGARALMILPGDMPAVTSAHLSAMWQAYAAERPLVLRAATAKGLPGHPVIVAAGLLPAFQTLTGDAGAARLLKTRAADVVHIVLPGDVARCDLDTPEDWAAWRAQRS